ncbi:methyl-accepting chemotaxis protein [Paenibacillus sacheonensis]|uniref:Methyl-accepting chemotaxis protein n=1 Tax=Paenibacillus sacheonensis TaxID=742054 RepID=A0A7X4YX44_9BACL|nr:methyl-accepting chemotaxis protein [Paenibacillus sacheonensis]MBM7567969.1 methyl-accepting chemotaxis protein [Paenibacillus sacheonensis]NBC73176.1 methyl-accepting chemotaxis protein [Paenibacillus sacheonensis]
MFDWLGFRKGLPLWWSHKLNADTEADVADIFEGIADTRMDLLHAWTTEYWDHLDRLLTQMSQENGPGAETPESALLAQMFAETRARASDFSEVFLLDREGKVACSTDMRHTGEKYGSGSLIASGLAYAKGTADARKCLFGPYADPWTLKLGPSTSSFHDKMTLLFISPIVRGGEWQGALCGRVPNDVIGDLIQRESGHVYPDSGDNYLFMAKPRLHMEIAPGTALSRSRFEDRTFTHGENLKDGVSTDWGTVSVKEHTELELMFTDPATGELHPGVANTIRNGSNLFVAFPGYSDYRHIPVIGKGVTFQLPHCPDVWGMMCEGDLEEVYRIRSIRWTQFRHSLGWLAGLGAIGTLLAYFMFTNDMPVLGAVIVGVFNLLFGLAMVWSLDRGGNRETARQMRRLNRFIRINAEGKGDLTQRLDTGSFANDETRELAKWINNMIDSLEGVMLQVKLASADVLTNQRVLLETTGATAGTTERVSGKINDMILSIRSQLKDIDIAKDVAGEMRETLRQLEDKASANIGVAQGELVRIGDKMEQIADRVSETNRSIEAFMVTTGEIRSVLGVIEEISSQTHLLALNASIEAARVGEQGKGFAVVASEIKKLADSTRRSTEEVHGIVQHIYVNAQRATATMAEGTRVVAEGTALVSAASEILRGTHEDDSLKSQIIDEVVAIMEKIALVSKQNRRISTEVEGNVQELLGDFNHVRHTSNHVEAITAFLQQLVGQFRLSEARRR